MIRIDKVKSLKQRTTYTCGPGTLRTILKFYGINVSEKELVVEGEIEENGTSHAQMKLLARKYNFSFYSKSNATIDNLKKYLKRKVPVIVDYQLGQNSGNNGHYSVVYGIDDEYVYLADPSNYIEGDNKKFSTNTKIQIDKFLENWWDPDDNKKETTHWLCIIKPKNN